MKLLIVTGNDGDTTGMHEITPEMIQKIQSVNKGLKIVSVLTGDKNLDIELKSADILISTNLSVLTPENSTGLKWVHITSAGTNRLPDFLINSDILITNSSGVHPIPISEHVFGFILMLSRKIYLAHRIQIQKKKWVRDYEIYNPAEVFGKTITIIGMGRIGERIAKIADAFGMNVYGIVRDISKKRAGHAKLFEMSDLPSLLKETDFVINCLPGTEHTKGIFNLKLFKKFKPGSYFINIGRGTSVVETDMIRALKEGIIAGAGLDVFETEPLSKDSELWNLDNVIITPHYSGWTPRYTERVIDIFIENLKAYLKKEKMPNLVDKELGY